MEISRLTCPKCSGLVVTEYGERRCVNCGTRPDQILRRLETETSMHCKKSNCETPAEEGKKMCRVHLDEACALVKSRYRAKRGTAPTRRWGTLNALVPAADKPLIVRPVKKAALTGDVSLVIDDAIGRLQGDLATLERAKDILSRG